MEPTNHKNKDKAARPFTKLNCMYSNVDSLLNKRSELLSLISEKEPDIICLTEILPKNIRHSIQESELAIDGFNCFTNINTCNNIRGIAMYIRSDINVVQIELNDVNDVNEAICCEICMV